MVYRGVIIEESLKNRGVLGGVKIVSTKVEPITPRHKTPWLKQWTLQTVEIPEEEIDALAEKISKSLDRNYWYADFKNDTMHYVVFPDKVFKVEFSRPEQYDPVVKYGLSLNIPDYQLDFTAS